MVKVNLTTDSSSTPLVSIIMPAYNAAKTIDEAISSIIGQTYCNWELIIVDDGSIDDTLEIARRHQDGRILIASQSNQGVSAARNLALEKSKGDFICFLDADDFMPPVSLSSRVDGLISNPSADFVDGVVITKDTELKNDSRRYKPSSTNNLCKKLLMLSSKHFFGVSYMIRSNVVADFSFALNASHCEDILFFLRISSSKKCKMIVVNEHVYYYRSSASSAMANLDGLSNGYVHYFHSASSIKTQIFPYIWLGKLRAMKILALCWFRKGEIRLGFLWVFRVLIS